MPEIAVVAVVVSLLSFAVSAFTFYRNSGPAQLRKEQMARMRIIAARAVVLWDQIDTIASAQVRKSDVDPYLFPSIQENARRLEEALDAAIGLGLFRELLEDRNHSLPMYSAFVQGVRWVASMPDPDTQSLDAWTKQHFLFGMIRLLDVCLRYKPSLLPMSIRTEVTAKVVSLKTQAWTYLSQS